MNNINTGEGPNGLHQYAFDKRSRLMRVTQRPADPAEDGSRSRRGREATPWLVAIDELHGLQIAYDWVAPTPAPAPVPSAAPTVHWTPWYQAQVSAAARALH